MWSTIANLRHQKTSSQSSLSCNDLIDDGSSSSSIEEGLECPICWESFNIVENVPYVLWCGHTLCQNCVLGLQWAVFRLPAQRIRLPLFVSCPWCSFLSFRLVARGNIRFPRKNYFILWMIESLNGERAKSEFSLRGDTQQQQAMSPARSSLLECSADDYSPSRVQSTHFLGRLESNFDNGRVTRSTNVEGRLFALHKSLDYFIRFAAKFPLVLILLVIVFLVVPGSLTILVLYLIVTVLLALPSILVLVFAYPSLDWLLRKITS